MEKVNNLEKKLSSYLCDENAKITSSEIVENDLGTYVMVYYIITDKYAEENGLYFKNRILEILLKRKDKNKNPMTVNDYANSIIGC